MKKMTLEPLTYLYIPFNYFSSVLYLCGVHWYVRYIPGGGGSLVSDYDMPSLNCVTVPEYTLSRSWGEPLVLDPSWNAATDTEKVHDIVALKGSFKLLVPPLIIDMCSLWH